jgi:arginine exporter protein ArgO
MSRALVAGLLAGYGIAMPVGAIAVLIVGLTARTSLRVGAAAALGVATADGVYATIAVLGGAAAAALVAPVADSMRWAAAAVLFVLAGRTAFTAWKHHRDGAAARPRAGLQTPPRAYAGLLTLTMLNPATIVYFAALVLGGDAIGIGGSGAEAAVFVVAAFAASASWQLLLAGGGSVLGRVLTGPRGRLVTAIASSTVIATFAVLLLIKG